jgi:hypothetical protein
MDENFARGIKFKVNSRIIAQFAEATIADCAK